MTSRGKRGDMTRVEVDHLARLLGKAVGDEKALDVVRSACDALGLDSRHALSLGEALDVLERIAAQPGIVGITARFAKSRLHLSLH